MPLFLCHTTCHLGYQSLVNNISTQFQLGLAILKIQLKVVAPTNMTYTRHRVALHKHFLSVSTLPGDVYI